MNTILKWLRKNETLVHLAVMIAVFYGIPTAALSILYPSLVAPLTNSAIMGLTLIALLFVSYKAASAATEWIKNMVARAALDQIRDLSLSATKVQKDRVIDFTSPNVMVVENISAETKEAVANLKAAADLPPVVQAVPVEKKERAPRAKSVKKEG